MNSGYLGHRTWTLNQESLSWNQLLFLSLRKQHYPSRTGQDRGSSLLCCLIFSKLGTQCYYLALLCSISHGLWLYKPLMGLYLLSTGLNIDKQGLYLLHTDLYNFLEFTPIGILWGPIMLVLSNWEFVIRHVKLGVSNLLQRQKS